MSIAEITIQDQLSAARKKLSGLTENRIYFEAEKKRLGVERWNNRKPTDAAWDAVRAARVDELATALVENRSLDPEIAMDVNIDVQIVANQKRLAITRDAATHQNQIVNELAAQVAELEYPGKLARLQPHVEKLRRAADAAVAAYAAYDAACQAEGVWIEPYQDLPGDSRLESRRFISSLAQFIRQLALYGRKAAA